MRNIQQIQVLEKARKEWAKRVPIHLDTLTDTERLIMTEAGKMWGVKLQDMILPCRDKYLLFARRFAAMGLLMLRGYSLNKIGSILCVIRQDHATIIHHRKMHYRDMLMINYSERYMKFSEFMDQYIQESRQKISNDTLKLSLRLNEKMIDIHPTMTALRFKNNIIALR